MLGSLSKLFGKVVARRNRRFDIGKTPVVTVDKPVISVGNLSVGGTGKTPMVQLIVRLLQQLGKRPAVVMRGYKRSSRGVLVVHDGERMLATTRESGDEAALHARTLGVPVVVGESKVDAAVHAAGFLPCDVIVVDDGFQHRALHRDVDVVLIDSATMNDQRLLPVGRLREPLTSLSRADIVVLTGADIADSDVRPYVHSEAVIARVQMVSHAPQLSGRSVVAFCGIANPERFERSVRGCGAHIVEFVKYKDHHIYTKTDIVSVVRLAKHHSIAAVTTGKDRVKLDHAMPMFEAAGVELIVLPLEAHLMDGARAFEELITIGITREDRDQ